MNVAELLTAGYVLHSSHEEHWEDIGGPESGPHVVGNPAYQEYHLGAMFYAIVVNDEVVDRGILPPTVDGEIVEMDYYH